MYIKKITTCAKRFLSISIAILLCSACGNTSTAPSGPDKTGSSDTVSHVDTKEDALAAYADLLSQEQYANEEEDLLKPYFAIGDLNADGMPECIIRDGANMLDYAVYYIYEDGHVVEIEGPDAQYPRVGSLYSLPSEGTYMFYRGGPAYQDEKTGNGYMPHEVMEFKLENHKIHMINEADWEIYEYGDKAGTAEYFLNGEESTAEETEGKYHFDEKNYLEFFPNTEKNREACGVNKKQ